MLNKSSGPDVVPNKIWKEFAWELAPVLWNIYSTSLRQGMVPSKTIENDLRPIVHKCQVHVAKLMERFFF